MTAPIPGARHPHPADATGGPDLTGLDFVAFDVETANSSWGSVCAIGVAEVRRGAVVGADTWLTRPPAGLDWFDPYNVDLHGIAPGAVADAPGFPDRLEQLLALAGPLPLAAHNAAFDTGVLRAACDACDLPWPRVDYACTLVLARRALVLASYRLPLVAEACGVPLPVHHDPACDAAACAGIAVELARRSQARDLPGLLACHGVRLGHLDPAGQEACRSAPRPPVRRTPPPRLVAPPAAPDADPGHPLHGQVVVFTGALSSMARQDAWDAVAACGAVPAPSVTGRTTVLVVGDGFTGDDPASCTTGKAARAAHWRARGHRIEVLTEDDLLRLLQGTRPCTP